MIGKPKFRGILALCLGLSWGLVFISCGDSSKTLTVRFTPNASQSVTLVAFVSMNASAASYAANIGALKASNGTTMEFYGHSVTMAGVVDDSAIDYLKRCAVYESGIQNGAPPELSAAGLTTGTVTDRTACTSLGSYFRTAFGDASNTVADSVGDALSANSYNLADANNGYLVALFFNRSNSAYTGEAGAPGNWINWRCVQICGRKVQNKQIYGAASQTLSDVLTCNLSSLSCYPF